MPTRRWEGGERPSRDHHLRREAAEILERSPWWAGDPWRERAYTEAKTRLDGAAAVIAADLLGVVTHWSPGAEWLYGWTEDEVLGRLGVDVLVGPADRPRVMQIIGLALQAGTWEGPLDVRPKKGGRFSVWLSLRLVLDDENREVGLVGVSRPAPEAT